MHCGPYFVTSNVHEWRTENKPRTHTHTHTHTHTKKTYFPSDATKPNYLVKNNKPIKHDNNSKTNERSNRTFKCIQLIVDLHLTNNFSSWTSPMPSRQADPSERARSRVARVIWHSPLYLHPYNVTMCGRTNPCSSHVRKASLFVKGRPGKPGDEECYLVRWGRCTYISYPCQRWEMRHGSQFVYFVGGPLFTNSPPLTLL